MYGTVSQLSESPPKRHLTLRRQCIYAVFGGTVDKTGEILHGKTSPLRHDSKGLYQGLPQDVPVTRYHSLAGTHPTLPACLEVSSWVASGPDAAKGVIMGVRHKEYTIESVQFHPESILTEQGRLMIRNFLAMQGGTWQENQALKQVSAASNDRTEANGNARDSSKSGSILETIFAHRRATVDAQKLVPSQRPEDLQAMYDLDISPPLIDFYERLRNSPYNLSLLAEIKRASPSKGPINMTACAPSQAITYARAGASAISVLTEPHWFKGSIDDLRAVRQALIGVRNRPAILRKEFVFDEYQILEARLAGADTVLLIVKMLDTETLTRLYRYSQSLGMEPLVEVNTVGEMEIAVQLGSKVIGVNNRNLSSFEVDLDTTSRLVAMVPQGTILCALSGISGPQDVAPYRKNGVGAVLVGEALMRAQDTAGFIRNLLGTENNFLLENPVQQQPMVKICGVRTAEAAQVAIEAGADFIGMILVTGRKRCVTTEVAKSIARTVRDTKRPTMPRPQSFDVPTEALSYFEHARRHKIPNPERAMLVGVFQNQPLEYVLEQQKQLDLDVVQLHGQEPLEWALSIPVPVIRAFHPGDSGIATPGHHALPLLDSGAGGSGERLDLTEVRKTLHKSPGLCAMLAGGLKSDNVTDLMQALGEDIAHVAIFDVSSGVEVNGQQDLGKIRAFVTAVKGGLQE